MDREFYSVELKKKSSLWCADSHLWFAIGKWEKVADGEEKQTDWPENGWNR